MGAIILRIFSGLHLGAEIELIEGVYVIGTDDSCDLILNDGTLKGRHAALRVASEDGKLGLTIEALDGPVFINGAKIVDECPVEALAPFQLGLLVVAWIPDGIEDRASAWLEVDARLKEQNTSKADAPAPAAVVEEVAQTSDVLLESEAPLSMEAEGEEPQDDTTARTPHRARDLALIASIVLVGALCFSWGQSKPDQTPSQIMRNLLDEAGYSTLLVSENEKSVTVTGRIASDRERGRLLRLAQLLEFPVYLNVSVHSDVADAVRASFNTFGLWPEVTELPPSSRPGVRVRGYVKNGYLEELALSQASRNVPALRPAKEGDKPELEIFSDFCHEAEVEAVLTPALEAAGVGFVTQNYLPGKVELRGTLTPQNKKSLEDVVVEVLKKLAKPVPFHIINDAEEQKPQANIYNSHGEHTSAPSETAQRFKVISVSMGAMKFITLNSGEIVFEGGELPDGSILETINVDALTLSKSGKKTQYPLKSSHE